MKNPTPKKFQSVFRSSQLLNSETNVSVHPNDDCNYIVVVHICEREYEIAYRRVTLKGYSY